MSMIYLICFRLLKLMVLSGMLMETKQKRLNLGVRLLFLKLAD